MFAATEKQILRAHDNGGVDADDLGARTHERPARIAGIERGVRLDDVADQPAVLGAERAPDGTDDPGGHGRLEAERVADGDGDLARANVLRIAQQSRGQRVRRLTPEDREIGIGIAAEHTRAEPATIRQAERDIAGAIDDVIVGQDQPVW